MQIVRALAYYRTNYLMGVARPGALTYDGSKLALYANDLSLVWDAPASDVRVKKGMGILTVSIQGKKASILTAIGSRASPMASAELKALLESGAGIAGTPPVRQAERGSYSPAPPVFAYAQGQKALREFFASLGVMD